MRVTTLVQATFAQLHQLHPRLAEMYDHRKLWEPMHADRASNELRVRFAETIERQRREIAERINPRWAGWLWPVRWILTIGAAIWFPLLQPVLEVALQQNVIALTRETVLLVVSLMSVTHLLKCAAFLLLWYLLLWILLRWSTQWRVSRLIEHWKSAGAASEFSLPGQVVEWIDGLMAPIRQRREQIDSIVLRCENLRRQLSLPAVALPDQDSTATRS
jgi:hypothetical protein